MRLAYPNAGAEVAYDLVSVLRKTKGYLEQLASRLQGAQIIYLRCWSTSWPDWMQRGVGGTTPPQRTNGCFWCGEVGHFRLDCP